MYYFSTGDINKNSGLEIEYLIDPGSTCTIINYPTFLEMQKLNPSMRIFSAINITKSYNGSQIRMLDHTTLTSYFDTDGKYEANYKVWVTQEATSNLIGVDFCHIFFKALYFDIPAVELKEHTGVISYGTLNNEKQYPQVSEIEAIVLSQPLYIQARSTYLYKHQNTDLCYPKGTSFLPHKNTVKTELVFINTVCTQKEKTLPILIENHKNHPITNNKGIIGYAVCDLVLSRDTRKFNMRDCSEFAYSILNKYEELDNCFMLSTVVNSVQEAESNESDSCINYINHEEQSIFNSSMAIVDTISKDCAMSKSFALMLCKQFPDLREPCKWQVEVNDRHGNTINQNVLQYIAASLGHQIFSLITKEKYNSKPTIESLTTALFELRNILLMQNIRCIAMPKIACGLDKMNWSEISALLYNVFISSGIKIYVYVSKAEINQMPSSTQYTDESIEEIFGIVGDEIVNKCKNDAEIATDFSNDAKTLCKPNNTEQFPKFRTTELNHFIIHEVVQEGLDTRPKDASKNYAHYIEYLKKFDFTQSDLTDDEFRALLEVLLDDEDVYSQHKYDIGRTKQKFHIPLKKDCEFKKQRPSKVPLHLRDKLEALMDELIQAGTKRELNEHDDLNSWFVNPIIILPKNDYVKLVIDARYLNSITDTSNSSWPLEPLEVLMTRVNGAYFTSSELSCAYHQVPLTEETQKLTSFNVGGRQYTYQVGFYGLNLLSNFFSKLMPYVFGPLIKKKQAITYIDDTLLQAKDKQEMFTVIREYHALLRKANLKAAPDKTKFFLRKVKFLGHVISKGTLSPITSRIADIQNLKTPESKTDVLSVLGAMGFYANYVINYHIDAKPLYDLVKNETNFEWLDSHQQVFDKLKAKFAHDISVAIPNPKYPFHIHADSST